MSFARDQAVQIEQLRLGYLLAAEHQQLLRQGRCPRPGVADLLDVLLERVISAKILTIVGVAIDDSEQIVEITSNAAC